MGSSIRLPKEVSHHISRVLRLGKGEVIELLNGHGCCYLAKIVGFCRGLVDVEVVSKISRNTESPLNICCLLALAKSDKVDLAVRQSTELGVKKIILFPSIRSTYRLKAHDVDKKLERWNKIAAEAMCQCGRMTFPEITYDEGKNFIYNMDGDVKIVAYEKSGNTLADLVSARPRGSVKKIVIAIGPEGGWENAEIDEFAKRGFFPVGLGPRILRYETAVVSLSTLCQYLWGDLS